MDAIIGIPIFVIMFFSTMKCIDWICEEEIAP
jgi:hypothetical protein